MTEAKTSKLANIAAVVVVLLAGALSASWAFIVPIFQAPDEPAHFDYAISIATSGRFASSSGGPVGWIVSPYTRYLMRATDFDRIMEHSSMRAPVSYGNPAYFATLDALAPSLSRTPRTAGVSYVAVTYPFGFYVLEAAVMRLAALTGSLTAIFFAGRLLCVALMMLGLFASYLAATNLGVDPWVAVMLTAAMGLFPMTTLVSSYIQPDNLAFALVPIAITLAIRVRHSACKVDLFGALGATLGLLAITKYHVFLAVAAPIALLTATKLWSAHVTAKRVALYIALFCIPTMSLLLCQRLFVDPVGRLPAAVLVSIVQAAHGTFLSAGERFITLSMRALIDFFITGGSVASYWGVLGWVDTPLIIKSESAEALVRLIVACATVGTWVLVVILMVRNATRLWKIGLKGHVKRALYVVGGDPVFNVMFFFVAIMIGLYALTDNVFGAEGRQWFPVMLPSFLCFVWYAPQALRPWRKGISRFTSAALLLYSLVAAPYATADVLHRYYGNPAGEYTLIAPPAPGSVAGNAFGTMWGVDESKYHVGASSSERFGVGEELKVSGYAKPPLGDAGPAKVTVVIDGKTPIPTISGQYNYLVAESAHNTAAGFSGFDAKINTVKMSPGEHSVEAYVTTSRGRYFRVIPSRRFFLLGRGDSHLGQQSH